MIYNLENLNKKIKIGERIRKERIAAGYKTQPSFAVAVGLQEESRTSVSKWENGIELPAFDKLINMCEIFDCEIGYLLCEDGYIGRTRAETDFQKATGLSKRAVEKLFMFRKRTKDSDSFSNFDFYINEIIENDDFAELLEAIKKHVWGFNQERHYSIDDEKPEVIESLTNTFNCEPHELERYIETTSRSLIESIIMKIVKDIKLINNTKAKKPLRKQRRKSNNS